MSDIKETPDDVAKRVSACNEVIRGALEKYDCVLNIRTFMAIPQLDISSDRVLPILQINPRKPQPSAPNP